MSGAGQGSEGDMKRARDSTGGGPLDHVLVMGTAGPLEQEAVHPYAYMHGHESDVDDSSEEEEEMERPVKKRKGPPGQSAKRVCREQGCDKWAQAGGLCKRHGSGKQKPCSVEGCGTLAVSRGLCFKHGRSKPCSIEGCGTLAVSRGLCFKHGGGTKKPCSVEGCGTLAVSKGLCEARGRQAEAMQCGGLRHTSSE